MSSSQTTTTYTHNINPANPDSTIRCYCNEPAPLRTSTTKDNPNRQFYCCSKDRGDNNRCRFFSELNIAVLFVFAKTCVQNGKTSLTSRLSLPLPHPCHKSPPTLRLPNGCEPKQLELPSLQIQGNEDARQIPPRPLRQGVWPISRLPYHNPHPKLKREDRHDWLISKLYSQKILVFPPLTIQPKILTTMNSSRLFPRHLIERPRTTIYTSLLLRVKALLTIHPGVQKEHVWIMMGAGIACL